MPESVRPAMRKGNRQERKERTTGGRREGTFCPRTSRIDLESELEPKLHNASASRSEDRIAVDDVRRPAPATERMGDRGVVADVRANHTAIRIGEIGVIEHVK